MKSPMMMIAILPSVFGAGLCAGELQISPVGLKLIEEAEVASQGLGAVIEVRVQEGQAVCAGQLLARIDDRDALIDLEQARIDQQNAEQIASNDLQVLSQTEVLKLAELDLARAKESIKRYAKSVSQAQLDRLQVSVERARLDLEQAKKDRETARLGLQAANNRVRMVQRSIERLQVTAPIDGVIVAVNVHKGEWVEPGGKMFRVVRTDRLRAEGFVHVDQLNQDLTAAPVTLETTVNGKVMRTEGHITFISPEASPVNGQVRLWAEIDNRDQRLRPGLAGTLIVHPIASDQAQASTSD